MDHLARAWREPDEGIWGCVADHSTLSIRKSWLGSHSTGRSVRSLLQDQTKKRRAGARSPMKSTPKSASVQPFVEAAVVAISSLFLIATGISVARAADIRLFCAGALQPAVRELLLKFEESSGHKVTATYQTAGALTDRIQKGDAVDVAIVSAPQIDELEKAGKVAAGSRIDIAKIGIGAFMRKGAAKPDISSVDAFKRSMLAAKSIAYPDPAIGAAASVYLAGLLDRLGVAAEMAPKTKFLSAPPTGGPLYENVASSAVDIGFNQISVVLVQPNVDFIGPLPLEIQNYTLFAAGAGAGSKEVSAGQAVISYLSSTAARNSMKSKGFQTR
jgi:molybdate transport system substrate-binding protein